MNTELTLKEIFGCLKRQIEAHRDMGMPSPLLSSRARAYLVSEAPIESQAAPNAPFDPSQALEALRRAVGDCTRCPLHQERRRLVFGAGNPRARLVFVGEAPGREEDGTGKPSAGESGALLGRIVQAMGLTLEEVYVCNVVMCRPPGDRAPEKKEIEACLPFLKEQLTLIGPEAVCVLGPAGAEGLLGEGMDFARERGRWRSYLGIPLLATHHPAFLLKHPEAKRQAWEDVKKIMKRLKLGG